jgi:DNA-binding transcriptional ArsR family regulator
VRDEADPDEPRTSTVRSRADEPRTSTPDCAHEPHAPRVPREASPPIVVERAAALFRALGDTARLSLLERLASGEYCVTELAEATGEGLSTISQRLRTLRSERLLRRRRVGKHVYYTLADHHVVDLIRSALEHAEEQH